MHDREIYGIQHALATNGTKEIGREKVLILIGILSRTHSLNSFKSSFVAITSLFYGGNIRISNNRMIIECDVFSGDPIGWFRDSRGHVVQKLKETFMAFLVWCRLKFRAIRIQNKHLSTSQNYINAYHCMPYLKYYYFLCDSSSNIKYMDIQLFC